MTSHDMKTVLLDHIIVLKGKHLALSCVENSV